MIQSKEFCHETRPFFRGFRCGFFVRPLLFHMERPGPHLRLWDSGGLPAPPLLALHGAFRADRHLKEPALSLAVLQLMEIQL